MTCIGGKYMKEKEDNDYDDFQMKKKKGKVNIVSGVKAGMNITLSNNLSGNVKSGLGVKSSDLKKSIKLKR